jgi:hypothetical protein
MSMKKSYLESSGPRSWQLAHVSVTMGIVTRYDLVQMETVGVPSLGCECQLTYGDGEDLLVAMIQKLMGVVVVEEEAEAALGILESLVMMLPCCYQ